MDWLDVLDRIEGLEDYTPTARLRPVGQITGYTTKLAAPVSALSFLGKLPAWLGPVGTGLSIVSQIVGLITSHKARKEAEERRKKQQALQMVNWLSNRFGRAGYGGGF